MGVGNVISSKFQVQGSKLWDRLGVCARFLYKGAGRRVLAHGGVAWGEVGADNSWEGRGIGGSLRGGKNLNSACHGVRRNASRGVSVRMNEDSPSEPGQSPPLHSARPVPQSAGMVIIVMGVSGSGKTTVGRALAQTLGCEYADADDFHPPPNVEKMRRREPLTDEDRRPWLAALRARVWGWLTEGQDGVLACSALTPEARRTLGVGHEQVRLVYLRGSYEVIYERIAARKDHFMPAELLKSQFQTLVEPHEAIVVDVELAPGEIVRRVVEQIRE